MTTKADIEEVIRQNIAKADARKSYLDQRSELARRAGLIGAQLAGQDQDEGVIDSSGVWHDIDDDAYYIDFMTMDTMAAENIAIERVISKLEDLAAAQGRSQ